MNRSEATFGELRIGASFWRQCPSPKRKQDDQKLIKTGQARYVPEGGMEDAPHYLVTESAVWVDPPLPALKFRNLALNTPFKINGSDNDYLRFSRGRDNAHVIGLGMIIGLDVEVFPA